MESLERFQQNRRVIEDFATRTLAAISSDYGRLVYLSSLREFSSGRYVHEGLSAIYPEEAVQQALALCHMDLFARILETPLEQQEEDLRACLGWPGADSSALVTRWQEKEFHRLLLPEGVPFYLRDLFCSNMRVLLGVLAEEQATCQPAA